ncbi:MAG: hypothetical protein MRZ79_18125 [Bacteroidia bacterium]|nr:hypothetical protein [Bacteroidia bacterium]
MTGTKLEASRDLLKNYTKDGKVLDELSVYCQKAFKHNFLQEGTFSFQADEVQLAEWIGFQEASERKDVLLFLKEMLYPLNFPIEKGISSTSGYREAQLKGKDSKLIPIATGLRLQSGQDIRLRYPKGIGGRLPVLEVPNKKDFAKIIQALAYKNEPQEIPESMGAILIGGITNWKRLHALKKAYKNSSATLPWPIYFKEHIRSQKELYQDKIIVLSRKGYSGVSHEQLKLDEKEWLDYSFDIRFHHESAHYFTQRYLGGMRIHLHDEFLADYMGITQSLGYFSKNWFLAFMGLDVGSNQESGRLSNYLPKEHFLSKKSVETLQDMTKEIAGNLASYNEWLLHSKKEKSPVCQILSISYLDLVQLAQEDGLERLKEVHAMMAELSVDVV